METPNIKDYPQLSVGQFTLMLVGWQSERIEEFEKLLENSKSIYKEDSTYDIAWNKMKERLLKK